MWDGSDSRYGLIPVTVQAKVDVGLSIEWGLVDVIIA